MQGSEMHATRVVTFTVLSLCPQVYLTVFYYYVQNNSKYKFSHKCGLA